jgi:hypothetical protein
VAGAADGTCRVCQLLLLPLLLLLLHSDEPVLLSLMRGGHGS